MKKYKKLSLILNFEVKDKDDPKQMTWHDAMKKYDGKGKGKWRLPTKDELNLLYLKKDIVGGFANYFYWSGSEYSANLAWVQFFNDGSQGSDGKNYTFYVRCVRSF